LKMRIATLSLLTLLCLALSTFAFAGTVYDDGAINGTLNSFIIDGPFVGFQQTISDDFVATGSSSNGPVTIDFGEWVTFGSTPATITWALGSTGYFSSNIGSGSHIASSTLVTPSNQFGFAVYDTKITGTALAMSAGTQYFLTLGGATDSSGSTFDGWDLNGGPASCEFAVAGADQGPCGGPPIGEAFTIQGGSPGTTPEPSSIMLFGSGILGLAGVLRRKMTR